MFDFNKGILDVGGIVDNVHTSSKESANISTERQRIDLDSPFKLPHLIRPLITIWSAIMWSITVIWAMVLISRTTDPLLQAAMDLDSVVMYTLASTSGILSTCVGWYFHSRRVEKKAIIEAKADMRKTDAAIVIRKIEVKEEIRSTKAKERAERKAKRREKRGN